MDKKYSTMVAVVAIFAMMFAGTAVVFNDSDDSSAANTSVDYKFRLELNDGTHTLKEDLKVQTAATITKDNYIATLKAALDAGGYTYVISGSGWLTSITKDGVTYESTGTWSTPGYTGFAVYYADGQSWLKTSTYSESNVFSIVLDEYKFTDPASDSYVKDAYDDYWTLLPTSATNGYSSGGSGNNTLLYIGIGVVAVVAVLAVAFFVIKKH